MTSLQALASSGLVRFTIPGGPESQSRHGFKGKQCHNKKAALLNQRRAEIQEGIRTEIPAQNGPIFLNDWLVVELAFYFNRPRSQMRKKGGIFYLPKTIRNSFAFSFVQRRVDVDNLAKFVLDLMKGPIYTDDYQVVGLKVTKVYDDDDECKGKTTVKVSKISTLNELGLF